MAPVFAANTGFLWRDRPFLERLGAAGRAGFAAVEFHDEAQGEDPGRVRDALDGAGLRVIGLNTAHGASLGRAATDPVAARADILAAGQTARALGAGAIHVVAGCRERTAGALEAYRSSLRHALEVFDGTVLIEPISPVAVPGYVMNDLDLAADIIAALGSDRLRILFDVFHIRALGHDPVGAFTAYRPLVGHVQLAGWPERDEPDHGPLAAHRVVPALAAAGYTGAFGCEYRPRGPVEAGLGWRSAALQALSE